MRKTLAALSVAALSTAALSVGLAAPANAELYGIDDLGSTGHGSDLLAVSIRNAPKRLIVKTFHENLRPDPKSGSAGSVFIDTDPMNKGPEYVFVGGFFEGTDYQLLHTEGFRHSTWGDPVDGSYSMNVDYVADTVTFRMSRAAIGKAGKVRIAVRVSGTRNDGTSDGLTDWLGEPRSFTPWIAKG